VLRAPIPPFRHADGTPIARRERTGASLSILLVTESWPPEVNGVARTVSTLVAHLRAHGHHVHVVRPSQGPDDREGRDESLVNGMPLPFYRDVRIGLPAQGRLLGLIDALRPDVVHVATEGPLGWSAVSAARRANVPASADFRTNFHLYSRHYGGPGLGPLVFAYLRRFHNRADGTAVPTQRLARELLGAGVDHIAQIGRGVDTALFAPSHRSAAMRGAWLEGRGGPVVLHVGRLAPEKNLEAVFDAFAAIRARSPEARLVLVGDGPLREAIARTHPEALRLGWRHGVDLARCYASGDLLLFPSLTETFGNVTLEAMASGLPVVAFDQGGAGELIVDGVNGVLVPADDAKSFAGRAAQLAADAARMARIGDAARLTALDHQWDRIVARFEAWIRHAVIEPRQ